MVLNKNVFKNTVLFLFLIFISCGNGTKVTSQTHNTHTESVPIKENIPNTESKIKKPIQLGAHQTSTYIPLLKGKRVAVVGNQTSVIFKDHTQTSHTHLVDSLLSLGITVHKVFAPEHGFRGKADAAEVVKDGKDIKTGIPILSLYGKHKKPSKAHVSNIDIIVFDIQDVGVRFYTYISTLHYVMQTCAEQSIPLLILDRPNPNGHFIDGPTLEKEHQSFVGMHPIPLVHGMTIGEYAQMINGEGWLGNSLQCGIQVIPMLHYTHDTPYHLAIRPSPNLPNDKAINLYPSLGLLEGTTINAGRGTEMQFQLIGDPSLPTAKYPFEYTPKPNFGAKHPKHKGVLCHGISLQNAPHQNTINLSWIIDAYQYTSNKANFFKTSSFTIHAGTKQLQQQIEKGWSAEEIKATWQKDLEVFKIMRTPYLLYP